MSNDKRNFYNHKIVIIIALIDVTNGLLERKIGDDNKPYNF